MVKFKRGDLDEINEWYSERNLPGMSWDVVPDMGFIVHGLACIFVYMTDSSIAMIEGLVSNPSAGTLERRKAVRVIVSHAYEEARKKRTMVVAIIKNGWVKELAKNTGYTSLGTRELFIRG